MEDDDDLRAMLATMLELSGYEVVTARNGRDALNVVRRVHPRVILLDLMMPVMDGETFRRHQVADPHLAGIPTICVSARHDLPEVARRLSLAGCLQKPIDFENLLRVLARHTSPRE